MLNTDSNKADVVAVAVPALVMLGIGLWGLDRGGMWRDEGVTFQVARRSVPQIWRLLHGVDAVHGLYYLLMHPLLALRPGEVALRLPSVCAAAATAGLVGALGVRLGRARVGLWAGLLYAVTPTAGHYAQEGRSYALVTAGAAGATLLLVRGMSGRSWWPYGVVVALTCLLHELAVLVLCAHVVTLGSARVPRGVWSRWGRAVGGASAVLLPLVWVSRGQAEQVGWLMVPGWGSAEGVLRGFFVAPKGVVFWACAGLAVVGVWAARRVAVVALPLMVVPPGVLIAVSQVRPLFDERYVLYALVGAPLLVAAGADRVAGVVGRLRLGGRRVRTLPIALQNDCPHGDGLPRRHRPLPSPSLALSPPGSSALTLAGALAVTLLFLHHRQDRTPLTRPDDLAAVSALAARQLRPGDPVLFLPSIGRRSALAYPEGFRGARDVALGQSGARSGTLYGREVGPAELRRRLAAVDRVWVVAEPYALRSWNPREPAERVKLAVVGREFVPAEPGQKAVHEGVTLRLHVRRPPTRSPASPSAPPRPSSR